MKAIAWGILVAALACGAGCARPDWIEQTLVTEDVTGTWQGAVWLGLRLGTVSYELTLEQRGPKVDGSVRQEGPWTGIGMPGAYSGPIDGTVAGDAFSFRQVNGPLQGELTGSGDEMAGVVFSDVFSRRQINLRRVNPSAPPSSQER